MNPVSRPLELVAHARVEVTGNTENAMVTKREPVATSTNRRVRIERVDRFANVLIALTQRPAFNTEDVDRLLADYLRPAGRSKERRQADLEVLAARVSGALAKHPHAEQALEILRERLAPYRDKGNRRTRSR